MTGTALTEEKEFRDIYGMDVVEIPTNRPVQRKDLEDAVYMTKKEKFNAVVEAVKEAHARQQPVLLVLSPSRHLNSSARCSAVKVFHITY